MDTPARILIVDDDPTVRETLRTCFAGEGYEMAFAADGPGALAQAAEWLPDLVLLDVMMPGMDGFEVCRRLRADPLLAQVPVILVTGLDDYDSRVRGAEVGADDFISKPYNRVELRARVRTITRLNRYRRLLEERERRKEAEDETRRLNEELQRYAKTLELRVAERTEELRAERDRTQAILESLGEAVVVVDARQTIQYVNPAFTRLTGYARHEAEGQKVHWWRALYHSTQAFDQLVYAVYNGEVRTGEVVGRRADGTLYDAMLTVAPLFEPGSSLSGFVGVSRDITPLKEADRLKDQFVSNVSHELRTPLSVITMTVGNLDMLYDRLDDCQRREMIRDLRAQARLLNELIGDILELSRIDSQRGPVEWTALDLTRLVRAECEKQRAMAEEKGHTMITDMDEAVVVQGNERQLGQVVRNLINNAIKYTPQGGQIICTCRVLRPDFGLARADWPGSEQLEKGAWAALSVRDTGVGIAAEHLPHIFERFYRVEMQSNVPGTGLGLSIVKGLVELHHGYVGVASTPGQGSTFAVYLPMAGAVGGLFAAPSLPTWGGNDVQDDFGGGRSTGFAE